MNRFFFVAFIFFLAGCQPYSPIEAFDVSENCPHICWFGINPGITTKTDTKAILDNTNRIKQKSIIVDESGIGAEWSVGSSFPIPVYITFEDGLVKEVILSDVVPLTINDFLPIFGEPDEIVVSLKEVADARYVDYTLFYSKWQLAIVASTINNNGPDLKDNVDRMVLTRGLSNSDWFANVYEKRQPWLGFGHLKDYFPGQDIPNLGSWSVDPESP